MKYCAVYTDFGEVKDWPFAKALNVDGQMICEVTYAKTNHLHGSAFKTLLRYFLYFLYPAVWVLKQDKYDYKIAWQQFFGINMAFIMRLLHMKKRSMLIVMTFIYNEKRGLLGKIYYRYLRYAVTGKYVDKIVVFSRSEVERYKNLFGCDKFVFIPLGIDDTICTDSVTTFDTKSVFGAGRSNRDWNFLIDALGGSGYHVAIATDMIMDCPHGNIKILRNCFGDEMLKEMKQSYCVVVPLNDARASAGQLVILQAMASGKPVIATRGSATIDYVTDGVTGYLIDNNRAQLMECLECLQNADVYNQMCNNALNVYRQQHTLYSMGVNLKSLFVF